MLITNTRLTEILELQKQLSVNHDKHIISFKEYNKKNEILNQERKNIITMEMKKDSVNQEKKLKEEKELGWKKIAEKKAVEEYKKNEQIEKENNKEIIFSKTKKIKTRRNKKMEPTNVQTQSVIEKSVKIPKVKEVKVKKEKVPSIRGAIINALILKTTKTHDTVVEIVKKQFPNEDVKKIRKYSLYIVYCVKKGDKRFGKYVWDETTCSLNKKVA